MTNIDNNTPLNSTPINSNDKVLDIVFAGTPEFAARHLDALIKSQKHRIVGVYTQPDRPSGRGKKLTASPVKQLALKHDLKVLQPASLKKADARAELAALNCDLMVVVAYGLILSQKALDIPRYGCINVHGSILPRWRGAAPIQRAIESGDSVSGVTIMQMDLGLDTGDMLLKSECPVYSEDNSGQLHDRLIKLGIKALLQTVDDIVNGQCQPEKQDDQYATYAHKIDKQEAEIDWTQSAEVIDRKIRAFNPFPICFTLLGEQRLKIHRAAVLNKGIDNNKTENTPPAGEISVQADKLVVQCGQGQIQIEQLQLPGRKSITAEAFIAGFASQLQYENDNGNQTKVILTKESAKPAQPNGLKT